MSPWTYVFEAVKIGSNILQYKGNQFELYHTYIVIQLSTYVFNIFSMYISWEYPVFWKVYLMKIHCKHYIQWYSNNDRPIWDPNFWHKDGKSIWKTYVTAVTAWGWQPTYISNLYNTLGGIALGGKAR